MKDETAFNKIYAMSDSHLKFLKYCNFMFKVIPQSYYWNKAREESKRLTELGYGF